MGWMDRLRGRNGSADEVAEPSPGPGATPQSEDLSLESPESPAPVAWLDVRIDSPVPEAVTCKIRFDRMVSPGGTSLFETPEDAGAWPAVRCLLGISGVHSIIGKGDVLIVARHGNTEWPELLAAVEPALRAAFVEDGAVHVAQPEAELAAAAAGEAKPETDSPDSAAEAELRSRVSVIIEEQINPAVASHGGYIDLLDIQGSRVFIHMGGGCQGCSMSAATLKHGVETTLRAEIPEITEILDTTDHASGENPYFQA